MEKLEYIGYVKSSRYHKLDKIYYNTKTNTFMCVDESEKERNLSEKQLAYLKKKFKKQLFYLKNKVKIGLGIASVISLCLYNSFTTEKQANKDDFPKMENKIETLTTFSSVYKNKIADISQVTKESIENVAFKKGSRDIEKLIKLSHKYIDENKYFTITQKEYLKIKYTTFIEDNESTLEWNTIVNMLYGLSHAKVEVERNLGKKVVGSYVDPFKIFLIDNTKDRNHDLFHELMHCFLRNLSMHLVSLDEGLSASIEASCCHMGQIHGYIEENEYLLLLSEIIGKEKLIYLLLNGKEQEFYTALAQKAQVREEDVLYLCVTMNKALQLKREEKYVLADMLNKKIKRTLAEWAITADEKNEENFIILNALQNKFVLKTSFFASLLSYENEENWCLIYDGNKYDYDYLFEEDRKHAKIKNN